MKQALGSVFQAIALDPSSSTPLYQQLYDLLCNAMLSGVLPAGSRMPSTRSLATDLGLSRNTVCTAFDKLMDDGFIESRTGDGSYVSHALAEGHLFDEAAADGGDQPPLTASQARGLSRRGGRLSGVVLGRDPLKPRPFAVGVPDLEAFPLSAWQRLLSRRARRLTPVELRHGPIAGDQRLRQLITRYLATARGVRCAAQQVIILPSAQLGLDLAARLLLDPGDAVWIEEPGYLGARGALTAAGARLVPVPVDGEGLRVADGRRQEGNARLAYVTPSHQFPLGVTMSLRRRLQLLAWAEETGAWIIEDDYDSEYRYAGKSAQAMQGFDRSGRVLYLGTFSKVLFPSLRLAYMVVPEDLIESFQTALFLIQGHVSPGTQVVLADFIEAGHFMGHLRRMRSLYRRRRDRLLEEMASRFGDRLQFADVDTGMHVTAKLSRADDQEIARRAALQGIELAPLSRYYLGSEPEQGFAFGYAHVPEAQIVRACEALQAIL